jgi:hypothetical protein
MDRLVQRNVLAMSGRAVEAAGDVDDAAARQDRHDHASATARPPSSSRCRRRVTNANWPRRAAGVEPRRRDARGPLDRRARQGALRPARPRHAEPPTPFVPFTAQTRMSASTCRRAAAPPQGRGDSVAALVDRARRHGAAELARPIVEGLARRAARRWSCARRRAERRVLGVIYLKDVVKPGMRERFDRAARDGHPHRDDHRRQPADRGRDRGRGGRRRLPRRGDARGQDGADPREQAGGKPRRDDRRRHQRRAGAGAGRRRRGDEHRHAGRARRPATWSTSTAIRPS